MKSPIEIKRLENGQGIVLTWATGEQQTISSEVLRRNCPCAECRDKRGEINHAQPLAGKAKRGLRVVEHSLEQALQTKLIWLVGTYALGIAWADGHDSGIYTFDSLKKINDVPSATQRE